MQSRRIALSLLLIAAVCFCGCAGVIEFKTPKRFNDQKVKEDPPIGSQAPTPLLPVKPWPAA